MASSYPGGLDSFDTIASDKKTSDTVGGRTHRDMHNDLGDAIEAVQTELGTDPAGGSATVKARFEVIEANDWVTAARIAADAVGSSEIAADAIGSSELADSAVDTAAIADGAVTSAKIADGTITATDVAASTFAAFGTVGNLLTANQASIETDATGWTTDGANSVAKSTAQARVGSASLLVTSPTNAYYGGSAVFPTGLIPVDAGETYTFMASVLTATGTRSQRLTVAWYTSGNSYVSGNYTVVANPTSWTDIVLTAVAPATAAKAYLTFGPNVAGADGDAAYWDRFSFHKGAGGQWSLPGVPITNTGIRPNPANTAEVQIWNDATATWITV